MVSHWKRHTVLVSVFVLLSSTVLADSFDPAQALKHADTLFDARDYEAARGVYEQIAEYATNNNQLSVLTEANAMIARTYLTTNKKDEGRVYIIKAGETATAADPPGWSRYLGVRGRFEWRDNNRSTATATFMQLFEYCTAHELTERAIDAAQMIAITGTPEQQIEWGIKGITLAETHKITRRLGPLWNNLGATYEELGRFDKAVDAYLHAREFHWRHGTEMNKLIADWAVGHAYRLMGDLGLAGKWLRPVLAWCERIEDIEFTGLTCRELGEIELARGNNVTALEYLARAEENLKKAGMPDWDTEGFQQLTKQVADLKAKTTK